MNACKAHWSVLADEPPAGLFMIVQVSFVLNDWPQTRNDSRIYAYTHTYVDTKCYDANTHIHNVYTDTPGLVIPHFGTSCHADALT